MGVKQKEGAGARQARIILPLMAPADFRLTKQICAEHFSKNGVPAADRARLRKLRKDFLKHHRGCGIPETTGNLTVINFSKWISVIETNELMLGDEKVAAMESRSGMGEMQSQLDRAFHGPVPQGSRHAHIVLPLVSKPLMVTVPEGVKLAHELGAWMLSSGTANFLCDSRFPEIEKTYLPLTGDLVWCLPKEGMPGSEPIPVFGPKPVQMEVFSSFRGVDGKSFSISDRLLQGGSFAYDVTDAEFGGKKGYRITVNTMSGVQENQKFGQPTVGIELFYPLMLTHFFLCNLQYRKTPHQLLVETTVEF